MELEKFKPKAVMPEYKNVNWRGIDKDATDMDKSFYWKSDTDFKKRHGKTLEAEKIFENQTLKDQQGENELLPALQHEFTRAGIVGAMGSLGSNGGTLAPGSSGEAAMARNLGLDIMGFQDRNRTNRQRSLLLAENLFPRREFGLSGKDVAQIQVTDTANKNNWNQAKYASDIQNEQFNYNVEQENARGAQGQANDQAQADAQKDAADQQAMISGAAAVAGIALLCLVCWVARAVFGEHNNAWRVFRNWLLRDAPKWLVKFYIRHGESIANVIAGSAVAKGCIRFVMQIIINRKRRTWQCATA